MRAYIILGLFSMLLLGGISYSANAQSFSPANHVVINEVETNPPGDDSKSIIEWVELFNPTNEEIYIGGWKIASTTVLKKILTISEGTTIKPGQFLRFSYQQVWFTDVGESVELIDESGNLVDKTPSLTDSKNSFTSWQRIYDGHDTDSSDDWKFVTSTAGSTNGKFVAEQEGEGISVTVSTDKSSYLFGETAIISGTVSKEIFVEFPFFEQETIDIVITGPNYYNPVTLYPDRSLQYKTTLKLNQVLGIKEGAYTISVTYADATTQTQFSVGDEVIDVEEKAESTLSISTDKDVYQPGQTASISAETSEIIEFEGLKFEVINPVGTTIYKGTLFPNVGSVNTAARAADFFNPDAQFFTTLFMDTVSPVYGVHTIIAQYGTQAASTTFELVKDVKEDKPISLTTDKQIYGLGETAIITGRLNNVFLYSLDLEILQTGTIALDIQPGNVLKVLGGVQIAGDGTFKHEFKIPNNQDRLGEYRVKVWKEIGQATTFFKVVKNPAEYVETEQGGFLVTTDKTIYDIGEIVTISGKLSQIRDSSTFQSPVVDISIKKADGSPITIQTFKPSSSKATTATFSLSAVPDLVGNYKVQQTLFKNIFQEGDYTIKASYDSGLLTDTTSFSIIDPLNIGAPFDIQLNKQIFGLGEEVKLNGIWPGLAQGSGITITLTKPDGVTKVFGALADNSRFSWSWTTPISEKVNVVSNERTVQTSNYGIYKLEVGTNSGQTTLFFKVSANPDDDTLTIPPIQVTTDKAIYQAGETLKVSGVAQKRSQGTEGLVVQDRAQVVVSTVDFPIKKIYESLVYLDTGGGFKTSFNLPVTIFKEGNYKVSATYQNKKAETLFQVDNDFNIGGDAPLGLLFDTDKNEYNLGETVIITGRPTKLVYLENMRITILHEEKLQISCGSFVCGKPGLSSPLVATAAGAFTHEYKIPMKNEAKGVYEVIIDTEFGKFSTSFLVTDAKAPVESVLEQAEEFGKRTTEKFNRIPDNFVPVSVGSKTVDEVELLPRIIQGSLLTPTRGEEANVNIKISTVDGTCVIGQESECLVQDSTRAPGTIYQIVTIDGFDYKIRYSGPDALLEKFTILPESSSETLPDSTWNVEVIKDEQPSRLYYSITYVTPE